MSHSLKPLILRQAGRVAPVRSFIPMRAFRAAPTSRSVQFPIVVFRASSIRPKVIRSTPTNITSVVTFHSTSQRLILPALPQHIQGTANDPAPVPDPSPTHGSYHWTFERLISAALIPLTVAPFAAGSLNPIMDATLCATILIHSHIGFQSVIIDYIPTKRLPKTRTLFWWGLRGATLAVAVGLYEFETNDVGVTEAIKRIWTA